MVRFLIGFSLTIIVSILLEVFIMGGWHKQTIESKAVAVIVGVSFGLILGGANADLNKK